MSLFKRGNTWWYEFQFRGSRIRETTKTRNRDVARRIEQERRRDLELGIAGLRRSEGPVNVTHAVDAFLEQNAPRWGKRTYELHKNSWTHLKPFFGRMLLEDIQSKHVSRYQRERLKAGMSGRTVNIEVSLVRMVLRKHRLWQNLADDVHMLREREDIGRALSPAELQRLLSTAQTSICRSLYPAILVSSHTGMRNQELRTLRWRQVDFLKGSVRVGKSKTQGGEGRVIPLSATALACLKEWRTLFPDAKQDHYVFPTEKYKLNKKGAPGGSVQVYDCDPTKPVGSWGRAWTTVRRIAQVSCRWHDMGRHTFVSRMGDSMVSDQTLMSITGHLSRKMLERYSHARMEAKRAAVQTLDNASVEDPNRRTQTEPSGSPQKSPQSRDGDKEVIQ